MDDDEIDLIINAAKIISNDLSANIEPTNIDTIINHYQNNKSDSEDEDLKFFSKVFKKRKQPSNIGTTEKKSLISMTDPAKNNVTTTTANVQMVKYPFVIFLRDCEDMTFENQFKLTKSTFKVNFI